MKRQILLGGILLGLIMAFPCKAENWWERLNISARAQFVVQGLNSAKELFQNAEEVGLASGEDHQFFSGTFSSALCLEAELSPHLSANWIIEYGEGDGVDARLGTISLFNYDALNSGGSSAISELFLHINYDWLKIWLGKMDWVAHFDTNAVANSEEEQFFSRAFVVNPVIFGPKGDLNLPNGYKTLGVIAEIAPAKWLSLKYGAFENDGDYQDLDKRLVHFAEVGFSWEISSFPGNLKVFYVENLGEKETFPEEDLSKRAFASWGANFDQIITEQVVIFARYGEVLDRRADEFYSPYTSAGIMPERHYSLGLQINLPPSTSALGLAFASNKLPQSWQKSIEDKGEESKTEEILAELYYRIMVNEWLAITPDLIYMETPAGIKGSGVYLIGMRIVVDF